MCHGDPSTAGFSEVQGAMRRYRRMLKPDGLFLAAMLGGGTLQEMRIACTLAQNEREGGVSGFVSPLVQVGCHMSITSADPALGCAA